MHNTTYQKNYATQERFELMFGRNHGIYMWNLYQRLGSIAALREHSREANSRIATDMNAITTELVNNSIANGAE